MVGLLRNDEGGRERERKKGRMPSLHGPPQSSGMVPGPDHPHQSYSRYVVHGVRVQDPHTILKPGTRGMWTSVNSRMEWNHSIG